MSAFVQELKHVVTTEIGARVEDSFEAAKRDLAVFEGRQAAFMDGAKAVEALLQAVDQDVGEGKYDLEAAAHVKRYVSRAVSALQGLSQQASNYCIAHSGRIQALNQTMVLLKGIADEAKAKSEALKAAEGLPPPTDPRERLEGVHPAPTIKEQRLAEEAAAAPSAPEAPPAPLKRGKRKLNGTNA